MTSTSAESTRLNRGIVLPNWVVDGDAQRLVEYAVAAEEAGWDGVFLADHLIFPHMRPDDEISEYIDFPDPWITLSGIATRTNTIRLGTWITPVPRRQPWQLARDLATLDRLSDGRVILGAGMGTPTDYTRFGEAWEPGRLGRKYDEALDVVTGLWRGEPLSYDGDYYTVEDAVVLPTPVQEPRIPIIVGGHWPNRKPIQRGARWDGIIPHYRGDGVVSEQGVEGLVRGGDVDPEAEVREMLDYYRGLTDGSGEVFLPADPPHRSSTWLETCGELGATWVYTRPRDQSGEWALSMDLIREGPPE